MAKTKKDLDLENASLRQKVLDLQNELKTKKVSFAKSDLPDFTVGIFQKDERYHLAQIIFNGETLQAEVKQIREVKIGGGQSIAVAEMERDNLMADHKLGRLK